MDIGFYNRGINAELLAVLQAEFHGRLDYELVDGRQWGRSDAIESAIEGIVQGDGLAIELPKGTPRKAIIDALAQIAVVPILDPHEKQRA